MRNRRTQVQKHPREEDIKPKYEIKPVIKLIFVEDATLGAVEKVNKRLEIGARKNEIWMGDASLP
ncbi:hypothetical protein TorRG33x02_141540 [Trema orientale]|uniref:Uncharacterized protein n=1 Tax=Trema orientale TaxID=63057 RepID=A0A2P5EX54_TREOI|nr:hypothetical protein TorRG33x02_141540 [Trema orientale]